MRLPIVIAAIGWQDLRALPLVALLAGALGLGAVVFYWPQSKPLPRRWRWILAGLRLTALLALAVSLLQPVITRAPGPAERGAIVLMVDHSHGMGIHDRQRKPAQWVALADGLGRLPAGVRSRGDSLNRSVAAARQKFDDLSTAQSRLSFASISGHSTLEASAQLSAAFSDFDASANALVALHSQLNAKTQVATALATLQKQLNQPRDGAKGDTWLPDVRAALDAVATAATNYQAGTDQTLYNTNPQVRSICDELAGLSRLGLAEEAIVRPGTGLLSNLPPQTPIYGFAIGDEVSALPLRGGGHPVRHLSLDTEAAGIDLASGIRSALDHLNGVSVEAVVLFSDGRRSAGKSPGASPAVGVPVYPIAAASSGSLQDWSLSHLIVPEGAFAGEPFAVQARVHGVGMRPGAAVEVRCLVDEASVSLPAKRVVLGADLAADVEFNVTIDNPGSRRITLQLPETPGEITSENNRVERWLKVYPRRPKGVLLAAAPFWDFQFLRDAIGARGGDPWQVEILDAGKCTLSPEQILRQDVMVLFDVAAASLDAAQWSAVRALAEERGGLVMLVAGAEHLPAEYGAGPLADLLPYWVEQVAATQPMNAFEQKPAWRTWQGEEPVYRFGPADQGPKRLRLASTDAADGRAWDSLTPLYRYLSLPPLKPVARPLLVERQSGDPVITTMPLGAGRIVFVGLDETWRWRNKTGRGAQEGIWLQLLRDWAEPPYAVTEGRLSLEIAKAAVSPGEAVEVRAKLVDADGSPARLSSVDLRVLRAGEFKFAQSLRPVDGATGQCAGTLLGLPAGDYVLQASADGQAVEYPLHVVRQYQLDLEDPSGDRASLERIAKASGGRVLTLEQLRELTPILAAVAAEPHPVTLRLWDSAYLFVFVVACFAAEWALRKRMGLA